VVSQSSKHHTSWLNLATHSGLHRQFTVDEQALFSRCMCLELKGLHLGHKMICHDEKWWENVRNPTTSAYYFRFDHHHVSPVYFADLAHISLPPVILTASVFTFNMPPPDIIHTCEYPSPVMDLCLNMKMVFWHELQYTLQPSYLR
jgi:hypothetical protein